MSEDNQKPVKLAKKICWNCGSESHLLSDCPNEIRQDRKRHYRKVFRTACEKEQERQRHRFMNFLLKHHVTPPGESEPKWESMTKGEVATFTKRLRDRFMKRQREDQFLNDHGCDQ